MSEELKDEFKNLQLHHLITTISLSSIGIIIIVLAFISYKKENQENKNIRKFILYQLNLSCILHCASHFTEIMDRFNTTRCFIEGAITLATLLITLLFTVQMCVFAYYDEKKNQFFKNHFKTISIISSAFSWIIPITLSCVLINSENAFVHLNDDYNCFFDKNNKKSEIIIEIYVIILTLGLVVCLVYTCILFIKNKNQRENENACKNSLNIFFGSINLITYFPTIIQIVLHLYEYDSPIAFVFITDAIEIMSGVIFVICYEHQNIKICSNIKKNNENKMYHPLIPEKIKMRIEKKKKFSKIKCDTFYDTPP